MAHHQPCSFPALLRCTLNNNQSRAEPPPDSAAWLGWNGARILSPRPTATINHHHAAASAASKRLRGHAPPCLSNLAESNPACLMYAHAQTTTVSRSKKENKQCTEITRLHPPPPRSHMMMLLQSAEMTQFLETQACLLLIWPFTHRRSRHGTRCCFAARSSQMLLCCVWFEYSANQPKMHRNKRSQAASHIIHHDCIIRRHHNNQHPQAATVSLHSAEDVPEHI